jgi:hypothetical protein
MTGIPERTPAEELREAAQMLRDTASGATRGPWVHHPTVNRDLEDDFAWTICRTICEGTGDGCDPDCGQNVLTTGAEGCEEDNVTMFDAAWIALTHPGLAEPLAVWLEDAARQYDDFAKEYVADVAERVVWYALAVARVINGGAS